MYNSACVFDARAFKIFIRNKHNIIGLNLVLRCMLTQTMSIKLNSYGKIFRVYFKLNFVHFNDLQSIILSMWNAPDVLYDCRLRIYSSCSPNKYCNRMMFLVLRLLDGRYYCKVIYIFFFFFIIINSVTTIGIVKVIYLKN